MSGLAGAALSEHPVTATAVGECIGQVLESCGPSPTLAMLVLTRPHGGALEDAAAAVRALLAPQTLIGCTSESVLANGEEAEHVPAVALWTGHVGPTAPLRLGVDPDGDITGWPPRAEFEPAGAILLADPFSFPADDLIAAAAVTHPGMPLVGGNASGAVANGGSRLLLDDRVHVSGAVGALVSSQAGLSTLVSQGCRPIGRPWVVTRCDGPLIYELGGRPALERVMELAESGLTAEEIQRLNQGGLQIGVVLDEHKTDHGPGDFLVRNVHGGNREVGAIAVDHNVALGSTVQFHLRDADAAHDEMRLLLSTVSGGVAGALVFTCNGRGTRLFDSPNHDATEIAEALGRVPTAGMFAAGEFGPLAGRNHLHGYTASVALFAPSPSPHLRPSGVV